MKLDRTWRWVTLLSIFFISTSVQSAGTGKEMRKAAYAGDIETVKQLLEEGVNPNSAGKKGGTPLIKAAKSGNMNIVQLLLYHDADPHQKNNKGRSAIDVAHRNENNEIAAIMTEAMQEQAATLGVKHMSHEEFVNVMGGTFRGRGWIIEETGQYKLTAKYQRGERAYKVEASLHDHRIIIRFIKGYGAKRSNYLNNLKKDLMQRL